MASHKNGRINSRPNSQKNLGSTTTGMRELGLGDERDGYLYVPESVNFKAPVPLIVMLHADGGDAQDGLAPIKKLADKSGTIVLLPESQGGNWDALEDGFGADVELIDEALTDAFALYPIDPEKIAVAGVADGASYALKLGATNNDLFTHVIAFSPRPTGPQEVATSSKVFVSQEGGEDVPAEVSRRAFAWFLGRETMI